MAISAGYATGDAKVVLCRVSGGACSVDAAALVEFIVTGAVIFSAVTLSAVMLGAVMLGVVMLGAVSAAMLSAVTALTVEVGLVLIVTQFVIVARVLLP